MSKTDFIIRKSSDPERNRLNIETYDESMTPLFALAIDEKTRKIEFMMGPGGVPFVIDLNELRELFREQEKQLVDWANAVGSREG